MGVGVGGCVGVGIEGRAQNIAPLQVGGIVAVVGIVTIDCYRGYRGYRGCGGCGGCGAVGWAFGLFGGLGELLDVDVLLGEWDFDVVVL